MQDLMISQW